MKYVILTITFFLILFCVIFGFLFYSSYIMWLKSREDVFIRLYYLKEKLQEGRNENVSLFPDLRKSEKTIVYDRHQKVIGMFSSGSRRILSYKEIHPLLLDALLLMEDRNFFSHRGFDLRGMAGALLENIRTLSYARGGSTITQQLAKILFTDSAKTMRRKIYELFCTLEIEKRFTKREILALYLNSIYFGHHNYGIESAAEFYFQTNVFDLNVYEVALLIGIIPGPNRYSPLLHPERAKRRQKIVLNTLIQSGRLEVETVSDGLIHFWEQFSGVERRPAVSLWSMERNAAPYFIEYVRQELESRLGAESVKRGGLKVYTTLDSEINRTAERVLTEGLSLQNLRTSELIGEVDQSVEGALIGLDPRSGHILAMVGGRGFSFENQFNRAAFAKRQIGSAFKPFIFAAGIEAMGLSPDSLFMDEPLEIEIESGVWRPQNYNQRYYGRVSMEFALKKSLNSVAVQLLQQVGPENVIRILGNALDLTPEETEQRFEQYPSMALGVYSFSPLEITRAYAIFPNHGEKVFPFAIMRVEDGKGEVLIDNQRVVKKLRVVYDMDNNLRVIDRKTADIVSHMLGEVVQKGGTAHQALVTAGISLDAYGKTGTTDNYTDAWFIGFTDDIIAAVWVGFDDPQYTLGKGQAGGVVAAPIWANFLKYALWRE